MTHFLFKDWVTPEESVGDKQIAGKVITPEDVVSNPFLDLVVPMFSKVDIVQC